MVWMHIRLLLNESLITPADIGKWCGCRSDCSSMRVWSLLLILANGVDEIRLLLNESLITPADIGKWCGCRSDCSSMRVWSLLLILANGVDADQTVPQWESDHSCWYWQMVWMKSDCSSMRVWSLLLILANGVDADQTVPQWESDHSCWYWQMVWMKSDCSSMRVWSLLLILANGVDADQTVPQWESDHSCWYWQMVLMQIRLLLHESLITPAHIGKWCGCRSDCSSMRVWSLLLILANGVDEIRLLLNESLITPADIGKWCGCRSDCSSMRVWSLLLILANGVDADQTAPQWESDHSCWYWQMVWMQIRLLLNESLITPADIGKWCGWNQTAPQWESDHSCWYWQMVCGCRSDCSSMRVWSLLLILANGVDADQTAPQWESDHSCWYWQMVWMQIRLLLNESLITPADIGKWCGCRSDCSSMRVWSLLLILANGVDADQTAPQWESAHSCWYWQMVWMNIRLLLNESLLTPADIGKWCGWTSDCSSMRVWSLLLILANGVDEHQTAPQWESDHSCWYWQMVWMNIRLLLNESLITPADIGKWCGCRSDCSSMRVWSLLLILANGVDEIRLLLNESLITPADIGKWCGWNQTAPQWESDHSCWYWQMVWMKSDCSSMRVWSLLLILANGVDEIRLLLNESLITPADIGKWCGWNQTAPQWESDHSCWYWQMVWMKSDCSSMRVWSLLLILANGVDEIRLLLNESLITPADIGKWCGCRSDSSSMRVWSLLLILANGVDADQTAPQWESDHSCWYWQMVWMKSDCSSMRVWSLLLILANGVDEIRLFLNESLITPADIGKWCGWNQTAPQWESDHSCWYWQMVWMKSDCSSMRVWSLLLILANGVDEIRLLLNESLITPADIGKWCGWNQTAPQWESDHSCWYWQMVWMKSDCSSMRVWSLLLILANGVDEIRLLLNECLITPADIGKWCGWNQTAPQWESDHSCWYWQMVWMKSDCSSMRVWSLLLILANGVDEIRLFLNESLITPADIGKWCGCTSDCSSMRVWSLLLILANGVDEIRLFLNESLITPADIGKWCGCRSDCSSMRVWSLLLILANGVDADQTAPQWESDHSCWYWQMVRMKSDCSSMRVWSLLLILANGVDEIRLFLNESLITPADIGKWCGWNQTAPQWESDHSCWYWQMVWMKSDCSSMRVWSLLLILANGVDEIRLLLNESLITPADIGKWCGWNQTAPQWESDHSCWYWQMVWMKSDCSSMRVWSLLLILANGVDAHQTVPQWESDHSCWYWQMVWMHIRLLLNESLITPADIGKWCGCTSDCSSMRVWSLLLILANGVDADQTAPQWESDHSCWYWQMVWMQIRLLLNESLITPADIGKWCGCRSDCSSMRVWSLLLIWANGVDADQTAPQWAVWSLLLILANGVDAHQTAPQWESDQCLSTLMAILSASFGCIIEWLNHIVQILGQLK